MQNPAAGVGRLLKQGGVLLLLALLPLGLLMASTPPPQRLLYLQRGMAPDEQFKDTVALLERAATEGYTGVVIADYKFMRWDSVPDSYRRRWQELRGHCSRLNLKLIAAVMPMGYSNGLLSRDPNLVEGLPVRSAPFRVRDGRLVPDDAATIVNGGFEAFRGQSPEGWSFVDAPGRIAFKDTTVRQEGVASLRMQDVARYEPDTLHARACQKLKLAPFRYYHVSVYVKTRNWVSDDTRIMVLGDRNMNLTFQSLPFARTQDWKRMDITFNTLEASRVNLYLGTWAGGTGEIWWDDVRIEPAGFMNVIRRDGAPLKVTSLDGETVYEELRDFSRVEDPGLGMDPWAGDYTSWHQMPVVTIPPGSRIREGQGVLASYYHPAIIYDGQMTCCLNEAKVYAILEEQARQVREAVHPDGYLMSHDEIRVQGWDASCERSGMSPAASLASNVTRCVDILRKSDPGKPLYVWSDMFDPNHNAMKKGTYYLVKGDGPWFGAWQGLPADVAIMNWQMNPASRCDTLRHFSALGHRQILAGYYDSSPGMISGWLQDAKGISGVDGVMYTTWQNNYSHTREFIKAAGE